MSDKRESSKPFQERWLHRWFHAQNHHHRPWFGEFAVFFLGRAVGAALAAPVENMSEMGSSEFTARAQPCSYLCSYQSRPRALTRAFPNPWALGSRMCSYGYILVLRARRFFEVVFEGQPRRGGSSDENGRCVRAPGRLQNNGIFAKSRKILKY